MRHGPQTIGLPLSDRSIPTAYARRAGFLFEWLTGRELEPSVPSKAGFVPVLDVAEFVAAKLSEEIRRLHNPDYHKTIELFSDYAGVDLKKFWSWNHCDLETAKEKLGQYMKLGGDIVHRSRTISPGEPNSHPVKKVDLEKAINFLKSLVDATERSFSAN